MDFTRGVRPPHNGSSESAANTTTKNKSDKKKWSKGLNLAWIILLISVAVLILALVAYVVSASRGGNSGDSKYVQEDKHQAVFLTNGQVYFGKIVGMNNENIRLQDVYYLTPTQAVQPNDNKNQQNTDYTLVKLGCELHGPQDQMVIERNQVTFWENLKDDGKVAQGVKQFKEANPNGLQCNTQNQQNTNNNN